MFAYGYVYTEIKGVILTCANSPVPSLHQKATDISGH